MSRAMCRQVVEHVVEQCFVIYVAIGPVEGPVVRLNQSPVQQTVRPAVVNRRLDRRRNRCI